MAAGVSRKPPLRRRRHYPRLVARPGIARTGRPGARSGRCRALVRRAGAAPRSEEHTSELQSRLHLVCRLLLEKKKKKKKTISVDEKEETAIETMNGERRSAVKHS